MGFFDEIADTFKVVKDIVDGGIQSYKAGEKLDELIEKISAEYADDLTDDEKTLLKRYKKSARAYEKNSADDENNTLLQKMEDDRIAYLEAVAKNSALPEDFRNKIKAALTDFKNAENLALDSTAETLEKYAETDEQRAEIRKTINDSKRK